MEKAKVFFLGMLTAILLFLVMGFEGGGSERYQISSAGTAAAVYVFVVDTSTGRVSLIAGDGAKLWTRDYRP